jgi:hypothetical protein
MTKPARIYILNDNVRRFLMRWLLKLETKSLKSYVSELISRGSQELWAPWGLLSEIGGSNHKR